MPLFRKGKLTIDNGYRPDSPLYQPDSLSFQPNSALYQPILQSNQPIAILWKILPRNVELQSKLQGYLQKTLSKI